jgi:hypothetical protein
MGRENKNCERRTRIDRGTPCYPAYDITNNAVCRNTALHTHSCGTDVIWSLLGGVTHLATTSA